MGAVSLAAYRPIDRARALAGPRIGLIQRWTGSDWASAIVPLANDAKTVADFGRGTMLRGSIIGRGRQRLQFVTQLIEVLCRVFDLLNRDNVSRGNVLDVLHALVQLFDADQLLAGRRGDL